MHHLASIATRTVCRGICSCNLVLSWPRASWGTYDPIGFKKHSIFRLSIQSLRFRLSGGVYSPKKRFVEARRRNPFHTRSVKRSLAHSGAKSACSQQQAPTNLEQVYRQRYPPWVGPWGGFGALPVPARVRPDLLTLLFCGWQRIKNRFPVTSTCRDIALNARFLATNLSLERLSEVLSANSCLIRRAVVLLRSENDFMPCHGQIANYFEIYKLLKTQAEKYPQIDHLRVLVDTALTHLQKAIIEGSGEATYVRELQARNSLSIADVHGWADFVHPCLILPLVSVPFALLKGKWRREDRLHRLSNLAHSFRKYSILVSTMDRFPTPSMIQLPASRAHY